MTSDILEVKSDRIYFEDYPGLYFRKTKKSSIGKRGQVKRLNSPHACCICGKLLDKPVQRMSQAHTHYEVVQKLNERSDRHILLTILRHKGNHNHIKVMERGHGDILLARRP